MQVRVLGCSGSIAAGSRTTAFLIGDDTLIDAGTGVGDLTREDMLRIHDVFLTHSHLDHVACLPLMVDTIAAAGGTGKAYMISVADPTQTTTELQQALDAIRGAEKVSCDFALPAPPPGQRLDPKRVNVAVTAASGQVTPLVYSRDCSATNGWRYDDLNAPTRVELCTATCGSVQSDAKAKLAVAFGCATNGVPR